MAAIRWGRDWLVVNLTVSLDSGLSDFRHLLDLSKKALTFGVVDAEPASQEWLDWRDSAHLPLVE